MRRLRGEPLCYLRLRPRSAPRRPAPLAVRGPGTAVTGEGAAEPGLGGQQRAQSARGAPRGRGECWQLRTGDWGAWRRNPLGSRESGIGEDLVG